MFWYILPIRVSLYATSFFIFGNLYLLGVKFAWSKGKLVLNKKTSNFFQRVTKVSCPLVGPIWSFGALVHWSIGSLVHCSIVPLVHCSTVPLVHGSIGPWVHGSIGPWVHWSIGPLDHGSNSNTSLIADIPAATFIFVLWQITKKHRHRRNVTSHHCYDYLNFSIFYH